MRLLIVTQIIDTKDPILGFFHRWVLEFAEHFEHIEVICLKEGHHDFPENVTVRSLGKESGESRLKYLFRFYRFFYHAYMHEHVDFVFFHMGAIYNILAVPFFILRKLWRTKFLWWKTHGHINWIGKLALLFVDAVFTASRESFPIASKKRRVVGHAIDTDLFVPSAEIMDGTPVLLFVGRIMRIKRLDLVIEATGDLIKKGNNFRVRIVGSVGDSAYLGELKNCVRELGLEQYVEFVEGKDQQALIHEYQNATVVINPSETGSLDKVVLEAMACGVPVVAPERAYLDVLGPFGLTVPMQSGIAYSRAVASLLAQKEGRAALGSKLRGVVLESHALSTLSRRIFSV